MAFRDLVVVAQFAIDEANDVLVDVTNTPGSLPSLGIDPGSFLVLVPNTAYSINFDNDSEVPDLGRLVMTAVTGPAVVAEGEPLITPLIAPLNGLTINVTNRLGVVAPGANILQITVVRFGSVL
jgi:hypothetical protein